MILISRKNLLKEGLIVEYVNSLYLIILQNPFAMTAIKQELKGEIIMIAVDTIIATDMAIKDQIGITGGNAFFGVILIVCSV